MTTATAPKSAPLYVQFAARLREICAEEGLVPTAVEGTETGLPQNNGYFFVEFGPHLVAPALIVPKSKLRMGTCHVHIDCSDLDGYIDPQGTAPGKVVSFFEPDAEKLRPVIRRLANGASKRPTIVASQTTQKKPVAQPVGDVFGASLDAMLADSGSFGTEEESELELQTVSA